MFALQLLASLMAIVAVGCTIVAAYDLIEAKVKR